MEEHVEAIFDCVDAGVNSAELIAEELDLDVDDVQGVLAAMEADGRITSDEYGYNAPEE